MSFEKDNTVEAVPSTWISEDNLSCRWPKKYPKNFRSIVQSADTTPGIDWILYEVKVIKSYGKQMVNKLIFVIKKHTYSWY